MGNYSSICTLKNTDIAPKQSYFTMHMHSDYEIFCFLSGDAKYVVEGSSYPMHRGDIVLMRPSEAHRICLSSDKPYERIALNFYPSVPHTALTKKLLIPFNGRQLGELNHYPATLFSDSHTLHYLLKIVSSSSDELRSAYLTVLLNELSEQFECLKHLGKTAETNITADIIKYINNHITEAISLQSLSDSFFISKSQLNRSFKHIIGSTVYEYIISKRLLLAKKQIENGGNPTKLFLECGFSDYTAFYRAYRAKFGFPPSKTPTAIQQ